MAFEHIIFCGYMVPFFVQLLKVLIERLELFVQISLLSFQGINVRFQICDNRLNLTSGLSRLEESGFSLRDVMVQLSGLPFFVSDFFLYTLDISIDSLDYRLLSIKPSPLLL